MPVDLEVELVHRLPREFRGTWDLSAPSLEGGKEDGQNKFMMEPALKYGQGRLTNNPILSSMIVGVLPEDLKEVIARNRRLREESPVANTKSHVVPLG